MLLLLVDDVSVQLSCADRRQHLSFNASSRSTVVMKTFVFAIQFILSIPDFAVGAWMFYVAVQEGAVSKRSGCHGGEGC